MAEPHDERDPAQLGEGWAALREGNWEEARTAFEAAVAERETPEALEGLSWAAWWLDDAEAVLGSRERSYQLYKEAGEAGAAARMATWLASDQFDFFGATAVASGWLQRAHRLLDPIEPSPDHGWLAFHEGYIAGIAGESAKALELARETAELGRRFGVPDLEMLGLALEGAGMVRTGRVDEGMRCLDEATAAALEGEAEIPISGAWACCFLVSACESVRDYERASAWCDRIAEFADRYESRFMLAFCRADYGMVDLWRGRWLEAEAMLRAAAEDYSGSRPALAGGPIVALAELRRRQGRGEEALALLDEAGPSRFAQLCRGRLALDRGDPAAAAELAERCLRQLPEGDLHRVPALELLAEARTERGELAGAGEAVDELRRLVSVARTTPLRASLDLAAGRLAAAEGDRERARPLLEDAVDGFERAGGSFEASRARIGLAETLLAEGREEAAAREAKTALERLLALGATAAADRARRLREPRGEEREGPLAELTPREREVLVHVAEGLTNRQIAERLVVSEHTVHRHVTNILRKLELPSRTAAAALAASLGHVAGRDP